MKKLMTLMLGLAFLTGTVGMAFAQETTQEPAKKEQKEQKKGKKKGSKKKTKEEKQQPPAK